MKCLIPFSGKNKENIINLSSAELAKRVVKAKCHRILVSCKRGTFFDFYSFR